MAYDLAGLESDLLDLASMVEQSLNWAIAALKNRDHRQAQQVILADRQINTSRYEIENQALLLLTQQHPIVSRDLRYIAAVINIAGELERMGDYAKGIARISDKLTGQPPAKVLVHLEQMAKHSNQMLHAAMDAFIECDVEQADGIAREDDVLDDLYEQVYHELLAWMFADNSTVDLATLLLWSAHNIERIGDRVTNICERIRFVETGVISDSAGSHNIAAD